MHNRFLSLISYAYYVQIIGALLAVRKSVIQARKRMELE